MFRFKNMFLTHIYICIHFNTFLTFLPKSTSMHKYLHNVYAVRYDIIRIKIINEPHVDCPNFFFALFFYILYFSTIYVFVSYRNKPRKFTIFRTQHIIIFFFYHRVLYILLQCYANVSFTYHIFLYLFIGIMYCYFISCKDVIITKILKNSMLM